MLLQIAEEYNIVPEDLGEVLPVMKEEAKRLKKLLKKTKLCILGDYKNARLKNAK